MRACHSDLFSSELIIKEAFSITRKLFSSELCFLLNGDHRPHRERSIIRPSSAVLLNRKIVEEAQLVKMLIGFGLGLSLLFTAITMFILIYFVSDLNIPHPWTTLIDNTYQLSFQLILLWDLECDYMNAFQCCAKLNFWVVPKIALHAIVLVFLLVAKSYWLCALNVPMIAYLVYEANWALPRSSLGIYDPGEIHNRGMIRLHIRNVILSAVFYLMMFFLYLYW